MSSGMDRSIRGMPGYNLKVSLMQQSKYLSCAKSFDVQGRSESPNTSANSSTTNCCMRKKKPIVHWNSFQFANIRLGHMYIDLPDVRDASPSGKRTLQEWKLLSHDPAQKLEFAGQRLGVDLRMFRWNRITPIMKRLTSSRICTSVKFGFSSEAFNRVSNKAGLFPGVKREMLYSDQV